MFSKIRSGFTAVSAKFGLYEVFRLLSILAIMAVCFAPDWSALRTVTFIAGMFFAITLISHITRKYALFPYLDMKQYAAKALEHPIGAAIVFAAVCGIIMVSISTSASFFLR